MKKLLMILIAGFVLVMSQGLREVAGDDDEGISLKVTRWQVCRYTSRIFCPLP